MIWRLRGRRRGSVTLVKSNVKALLTACGHQKMLLRSPRGMLSAAQCHAQWGVAPTVCGLFPSAHCSLKRAAARLSETFVTVCDDGDGIFDTATTHGNIVTPSHIVTHAPPLSASRCARSDFGCFRIECRTRSAAALR